MKYDAKVLNRLGVVAVIAVLAFGAFNIVIPLFDRVQEAQTRVDEQRFANDLLRTRLAQLTAAEEKQAEIEKTVAVLRGKLPASPQTDTALQMIENSVNETGVAVREVTFEAAAPFTPRAAYAGDETGAGTGDAPALAEPLPGGGVDASAGDQATDGEATGGSSATPTPSDPRQQLEVTVRVAVPDEATALKFLDRLRSDTRIMLPTEAALSESSDSDTGYVYTLNIKLIIFYHSAQ